MKKSDSRRQASPGKKGAVRPRTARAPRQTTSRLPPIVEAISPHAGDRLRNALTAIELAYALSSPLLQSIESLMALAARTLNAHEASVIVEDDKRQGGLRFLAATGDYADELKKMRIPPGKGIAGFVYTTGQSMAVADVKQERSFYSKVDQTTGHSTHTILATPLRVREETIGVLEFVNRVNLAPDAPFSPEEMDQAALFADSIALLVDAHQRTTVIESFFKQSLKGVVEGDDSGELRRWISGVRAAPEHRELLALAVMLRDVAARGDKERRLCSDVFTAIARWTEQCDSSEQTFFHN